VFLFFYIEVIKEGKRNKVFIILNHL